jgi:A/G-specific adenine glycosylase
MLQQTQVSRVVERFRAFIERFPSVDSLAAADEDAVLSLWSGLGYYRRARLLHAAARCIVAEHRSAFPADPRLLATLPGVGRYTAGAIASMALGVRTPAVDGNILRVLLRLEGRRGPDARTGDRRAEAWAWDRAERLVSVAAHAGGLNEGFMELGATVCTPLAPRCESCPLKDLCIARSRGEQEAIPAPRAAVARRRLFCASILLEDSGHIAMERRPARGMWAGLWQVPTLERPDRPASPASLHRWLTASTPRRAPRTLTRVAVFVHQTTHREVSFAVWRWAGAAPKRPDWVWLPLQEALALGLSSAQRRVLGWAGTGVRSAAPAP